MQVEGEGPGKLVQVEGEGPGRLVQVEGEGPGRLVQVEGPSHLPHTLPLLPLLYVEREGRTAAFASAPASAAPALG